MKQHYLKTPLFFFFIIACIISFSCKSSNYSDSEIGEASRDTISQANLNESHEDLLTVDYKQFYDELAPHGEWIEVTSNDLKSDEQPSSSGEQSDGLNETLKNRSSNFSHMTFSQLFGVSDAQAADVNVGAFFVWRPDPSMAVAISAGAPVVADEPPVVETVPVYRPYTNGQWIASDEGWYFKAPTPYEEIVHHYGRWAYSPTMGWVWVPGRVRAPAWVDWREDDNYVAWTPIPPDVYVVNNVIAPVPVYENRYVIVEKRYFVEPVIYQHVYIDKVKIKGMKKLKGIIVQDRVIFNQGPQYVEIEKFTGKPVAPYKVVTMNNDFRNTWIENNSIHTFAPVFTKMKGNKDKKMAVTQPEKFNKFEEVWNRENKNNSAGDKFKGADKQKESKELKENNKGNKPDYKKKLIDDSHMKTGEKKEKPGREKIHRKEKVRKDKTDSPRKEIKRDNPKKEKREKSPERQKKDVKQSGEKERGNPKGNPPEKHKDNPKRDKKK